MPFYHVYVRFLQKGTENEDEATELDFSGKRLMRDIVKLFNNGSSFSVSGCLIDPDNIVQLSINETEHESAVIIKEAHDKQLIEDKYDEEDYVTEQGIDVTRKFIASKRKEKPKPKGSLERKNIFIVHGLDHKSLNELKTVLREFGLDPLALHEQASGGLTLAEKLEKYAGKVGFAFIILTPDDVGGQKEDLRKKLGADLPFLQRPLAVIGPQVIDNILKTFEPRARQNVIFEMGFFWGTLDRKRVCCLLKGDVEKPSDINGIVYVPFEESVSEAKSMIEKELIEAGYEIKK